MPMFSDSMHGIKSTPEQRKKQAESYYIYFVDDDGEMMLLADHDSDEGTTRWTPYHRVSDSNMPLLFKTDARAQKWINEINALPYDIPADMFTAKWEGVEQVHANPYGTKEATLKRMRAKK